MFDKIVILYNDKTLTAMAKQGLITSTVLDYIRVTIWIDTEVARLKAEGKKPKITDIVTQASAVFDRPVGYVWRSIAAVAPGRYKK